MTQQWNIYLSFGLLVSLCILLYVWPVPVAYLAGLIDEHSLMSAVVFVALLVGATVFMPVSALPLIPVAAPIFGPFLTGILSVIGWTLGAAGAFGIARWCGRPLLERYFSLAAADALIARIPSRMRFLTIVLLRMTLPVDLVSYALGFSRDISFISYITATLIGVSGFSFIFAYMGAALFERDATVIIPLGGGALALLVVCWALLVRHMRRHTT